ncbi:hypothetical protein AGLY_002431 [Aphis glycines]|uniref:Uncharacterized protein n=1 Tax=Aphis glycines TaxID=307491 RepID=A0A6G0U3D2_APHGL|nr:hypothetical protein AGLY_002431 [Aphis glycines]
MEIFIITIIQKYIFEKINTWFLTYYFNTNSDVGNSRELKRLHSPCFLPSSEPKVQFYESKNHTFVCWHIVRTTGIKALVESSGNSALLPGGICIGGGRSSNKPCLLSSSTKPSIHSRFKLLRHKYHRHRLHKHQLQKPKFSSNSKLTIFILRFYRNISCLETFITKSKSTDSYSKGETLMLFNNSFTSSSSSSPYLVSTLNFIPTFFNSFLARNFSRCNFTKYRFTRNRARINYRNNSPSCMGSNNFPCMMYSSSSSSSLSVNILNLVDQIKPYIIT